MAFLTIQLAPSAASRHRAQFTRLAEACDVSMVEGTTFRVEGHSGSVGIDPSSIIEVSASQYATQLPLGGHAGALTFLRNANRTLSFTLKFHAVDGVAPRVRQVQAPVALLDSLCYPIRLDGVTLAPPPVIVTIGRVCAVQGFISACNVAWGDGWGPSGSTTGVAQARRWLPESADVSLTVTGIGFGGFHGDSTDPFLSVRR